MRTASAALCLAAALLGLTLACAKEPEKDAEARAPLFTGKEAVRTVQLYLPSSEKAGFVALPREIYATASLVNQAKQLLQALMDGPKADGSEPGVAACFARGAAYHEVYLDGKGLAVVDLDAATVAALPGGTSVEVAVLYSLVRSFVANIPEVSRVLVLVDGEPAESLLGHMDLLDPLTLADF
jgi:hypothetical protein